MKKFVFGVIAALVLVLGTTTSCNRDKGPGTAEVKVIDAAGVAQANIDVLLYCTEPGCVVRRSGKTNELGVFQTEFDLPVVLRTRAVRYDSTITYQGNGPSKIKIVKVDSLCGEGFVQVENDEVASETVTILTCK
ncbi:MAG: hypothetical protein R2813_03320 [Flavobacteriales bacterium]